MAMIPAGNEQSRCFRRTGSKMELCFLTSERGVMLIDIVRDIHASGLLQDKFGKEIPILIHELEYYDEIVEQNIRANGEELVREFAEFCVQG